MDDETFIEHLTNTTIEGIKMDSEQLQDQLEVLRATAKISVLVHIANNALYELRDQFNLIGRTIDDKESFEIAIQISELQRVLDSTKINPKFSSEERQYKLEVDLK